MKSSTIGLVALVTFVGLAGLYILSKQGNKINDTNNPTPSPPVVSSPTTSIPLRSENIIVTSPQINSQIANPVIVHGEARTFENSVIVRVLDDNGQILKEEFTTADSKDIGLFGAFEITIDYPSPTRQNGKIEVFQYSAKDGSEIDKVVIPVTFPATDQLTVNVYFSHEDNTQDCEAVTAVQRRIPYTRQTARAALEHLLTGTTAIDQQNGFRTNINEGVRIQRLSIENGVARVDFNDALENEVGGSCRVLAIRAQITQTLLQFDSIDSVEISINGRTEDILQP